jgi:ribosomal protein S18 acetylase RimI-like enzyme
MQIRRATEADADAMRRLWDDFSAEAHYTPYPSAAFEPALLTDHVALVAEDAGEPVGTVYANVSSPHFGFVFGLYTRPDARRRGIARALMREIAVVLRDEGREHVVLSVDTPNDGARAFYERLGFIDAARTLRADVDALL